MKVPAEALGGRLTLGGEGLSGLLHHRQLIQMGLQRAGRFIHHVPWEYRGVGLAVKRNRLTICHYI